jgi:hypothetical protein
MNEPDDRPLRRHRRWPLFLFLFLAVVSLLLHAVRFSRAREAAEMKRSFSALVREQPVIATKARRARLHQLRYFLGYPMAASYAAADLARRLDGIAAPLRLVSVQVDPGLHDMSFELAVSADAVARDEFDAFLERLANAAAAFDVTSMLAPASRSGPRLFAVRGRVELQP